MFKKVRNLGIALTAVLCLGSAAVAQGAGIESAIQDKNWETQKNFGEYEIPVGELDTKETEAEAGKANGTKASTGQDQLKDEIIVGAKTIDVTQVRGLLICLAVSCAVIIFGVIRRRKWYQEL